MWIFVCPLEMPLSKLLTVGGALMQLAGDYKNCICIDDLIYAALVFCSGEVVDLATFTTECRYS